MTISTKEQLEAMRRQMEEEHRLDVAAFERIMQRFALPTQVAASVASVVAEDDEEEVEDSGRPSLMDAVLSVVLSRPNVSTTGRQIMESLKAQGFPLKGNERRILTSIGMKLKKLVSRGEIRITRQGVGREPNHYKPPKPERREEMSASTTSEPVVSGRLTM